jgi:hypothetical protein
MGWVPVFFPFRDFDSGLASVVATGCTVAIGRSPFNSWCLGLPVVNNRRRSEMTRLTIAAVMLLGFAATVYAACPLCP